MKKIFTIILVVAIVIFAIAGCSTKKNVINNNDTKNGINTNTEDKTNSKTGETIGKLVGVNNEEIKLFVNGEIKSYKVTGDKVKDYYLGETITLKGNGTDYEVSSYDKYNFDSRYTDDGDIITRTTGVVKKIDDDIITATTDLGDIEINNTGNFNLPLSSNVIFDYASTKGKNTLVSYYDEGVRMDLTVKNISRDVDGKMLIVANDANDNEYEIPVSGDVLLNVNHSNLKIGDNIKVYPVSIGDENPPKINANMIIK